MAEWIDLLDPSPVELERALPPGLHESDLAQLRAGGAGGRPGFWSHEDHLFGVIVVPVADAPGDDVYYQEVDVVVTENTLLMVRKTTPGRPPFDLQPILDTQEAGASTVIGLYRLTAGVADQYLVLVDDLEDEIGELEDHIEEWKSATISRRVRQLRHQILHVRRTLAPLRDAIRALADGRIVMGGVEGTTKDIRYEFSSVYDRMLRAGEGLEIAHDLLAGARDYYLAKVAQDQNDIIKRLTVIASLLLVPTFIVGLYGQNFLKMPEYHWGVWGYVWSWGLIVAATLFQLWYFRRKRWL